MSKVSIRDIARVASVSPGTVSLALRDHPSVAKQTKIKVSRVAMELGYKRDPQISALMSYLSRSEKSKEKGEVIAYISAYSLETSSRSKFIERCLAGAIHQSKSSGYRIEQFRLGHEMTEQRLDEILYARGIRGVLIAQWLEAHTEIQMNWDRYAVVKMGYSVDYPACDRVCPNLHMGCRTAFKKLLNAGRQRIALILDKKRDEVSDHFMRSSYLDACYESKQEPLILMPDHRDGYGESANWVAEKHVDAVITLKKDLNEVYEKAGLVVPDQVALVVVNVLKDSSESGYASRPFEIGAQAVRALSGLLESHSRGLPGVPVTITVQGEWKPGWTFNES